MFKKVAPFLITAGVAIVAIAIAMRVSFLKQIVTGGK